ncbi:MAG: hypothetical protein E3K32_01370 [wastewater metagenome]|nr:hypothetical protein [Candidatus Loosdrechtia aerotolerans]
MGNRTIFTIIFMVLFVFSLTHVHTYHVLAVESSAINNYYLKSAKTHLELQDYQKAVEALELAILLEPDNTQIRELLTESKQRISGEKVPQEVPDKGKVLKEKEAVAASSNKTGIQGKDKQNKNRQRPEPRNEEAGIVPKKSDQPSPEKRIPRDTSILIRDASVAVQEKRYDDALAIAELILKRNPFNKEALYIKRKVDDIKHTGMKEYLNTIYTQERLKNREYISELSIPYQDILRYPSREQWNEILQRTPPHLNEIFEVTKGKTKLLQINPNPLDGPLPDVIEDALNTIISFEFIDTSLKDVVTFLREKADINMIIEPEAGNVPITLKLKDVSLRTALNYILPKGYEYVVEGDILHIYKQKMELRVYDVRDILINLEDKEPLEFDITASYTQMAMKRKDDGEIKDPSARVFDLIELIVTTVDPSSWSYRTSIVGGTSDGSMRRINIPGQGEGSIVARQGQPGDLVVVNTKSVHKQIANLLTSLRASQNLQVSIEARFVTVTDEFLEDIGSNFSKLFSDGVEVDTGAQDISGSLLDEGIQGLSINYSILNDDLVRGLIRAIQESRDSEILTSPRITLSNTQRGNIAVVQTRNYVQSTAVSEGIVTPVIGTVPEGTTFDVRPIVSADRKYIYLEVTPSVFQIEAIDEFTFTTGVSPDTEISSGVAGVVDIPPTQTVQLPRLNVSQVSVTVCVPDKGTLMIGGLGDVDRQTITTGIPLLSKIPVIKRLFSRTRKTNEKSNLIILLKPTIIIRRDQAENTFERLYNRYNKR